MNLILFLLILSSDETNQLIKQMGDDSYIIREEATEKLVLQGIKIFPLLEEVKNTTDDLEIKWRCDEVKARYYSIAPHNISIWMLPIKYRFLTDGEETTDVSQEYFDQCEGIPAEKAILATNKYFIDQLNDNKISREELINIRGAMFNNAKKLSFMYATPGVRPDLFYYGSGLVEPIENRLVVRPKLKDPDEEEFFDAH